MRRAPVILWLYILNELWRLILLTTCILVIVLSFAAAVRFLADGRLGPIETIRLMFLAMPPMLQYALPFAAGFGATLAYHRACADNELTAGYAAGISHRSILAPAVVSGVVLAGVVLVLSNLIIPRFLRSMEELVTRDAARMIVNAIERKEAVQMENTLLYADLVRRFPSPEARRYEKLYLQGVFAVELDKQGQVRYQVSAKEAEVWLVRAARAEVGLAEGSAGAGGSGGGGDSVTHVIIRSREMIGQETGKGALQGGTMNLSRVIPNAFTDDPKFLSWDELVRLRREPERLNVIDSRRRTLAAHLAERAVTGAIARSFKENGSVRFVGDEETGVTVRASSIHWNEAKQEWVVDPGTGADGKPAPLLVERRSESGRVVNQQAQEAAFKTAVDPDSPDRQVTITLTLRGLSGVKDAGRRDGATPVATSAGSQFKPQTIAELVVPEADVASLMTADTSTLLVAADRRMGEDPADDYVKAPRDELRRRVADLMREITSKQQERFASAAACLVMIVTGAVMAIKLRAKLPLEVYLWAFFPALATIITISAGQQMIHAKGMVGVPIMWAGVVGLGIYTFIQFRHVARH